MDDDRTASVRNTVTAHTAGQIVQAGRDVHLYQGADVRVVATARSSPTFGEGSTVDVDGRAYLAHGLVAWTGPVRRARVAALAPHQGFGWLRQADGAAPERDALDAEAEIARAIGTPHVLQHAPGATSTLVTAWPGDPADTLDSRLDDRPIADGRLLGILCGLLPVCDALVRLHGLGYAHRGLAPDVVIASADGKWVLRDLGLVGFTARPGERGGDYAAPEQRRRVEAPPGPATDAYQVAAMVYRVLTGRQAEPERPLPVRSWAPGTPAGLAQAVDAALAADPHQRPGLPELRTAIGAG